MNTVSVGTGSICVNAVGDVLGHGFVGNFTFLHWWLRGGDSNFKLFGKDDS